MKFSFLHRALSILLVVVFLITGFILVANTQDLISNTETDPGKSLTFKFIVLFFSGFSLFILNLFRPCKEVVVEKLISHEPATKEKETKEGQEIEQEEKLELRSEEELEKEADELFPKIEIDNIDIYTDKLLTNISRKLELAQGLIFLRDEKDNIFKVSGKYAYFAEEPPKDFIEGETLSGQVAKNQQLVNIDDIPEGYVKAISGLGTSYPNHLLIVPAIYNDKTVGIIEIASFKFLDKNFENLMQLVANKLVEKITKVTGE